MPFQNEYIFKDIIITSFLEVESYFRKMYLLKKT